MSDLLLHQMFEKLTSIEQKMGSMATKDDIANMATKDDIAILASKMDRMDHKLEATFQQVALNTEALEALTTIVKAHSTDIQLLKKIAANA